MQIFIFLLRCVSRFYSTGRTIILLGGELILFGSSPPVLATTYRVHATGGLQQDGLNVTQRITRLADKVEAARSRTPARKIATGAFLDDRFNFRLKKHQLAPMLSKLLTQLFDLSYDTFFFARFHFSENLLGKHTR